MNTSSATRPRWILPVIIVSQFAGTSLWFAGNAILPDLIHAIGIPENSTGLITSAVQLGFISGTLVFAITSLSDRFSPRVVFLLCAISGALFNLGPWFYPGNYLSLLLFRFITGFFLAGIYPVGMKIAASWYKGGLGKALGYLVGALVLGTAFPHLIKSTGGALPWEQVLLWVSGIASGGGMLLYLTVPDGPYHKRNTSGFNPVAIFHLFRIRKFRSAALGYFGHMWELYTFWAFIPLLLAHISQRQDELNIPLWSFILIGSGALSCVAGGLISLRKGSAKVAFTCLLISGLCCLLSPVLLEVNTLWALAFLWVWGLVVIPDSPQFSTLVATNADPKLVGSGLTIVNSIGFALTILSLQLTAYLLMSIPVNYSMLILLPGPLAGLISMKSLFRSGP